MILLSNLGLIVRPLLTLSHENHSESFFHCRFSVNKHCIHCSISKIVVYNTIRKCHFRYYYIDTKRHSWIVIY